MLFVEHLGIFEREEGSGEAHNDTKAMRAIVRFKQAGMLVDAVSLTHIANKNKLIVDISKISPWKHSDQC